MIMEVKKEASQNPLDRLEVTYTSSMVSLPLSSVAIASLKTSEAISNSYSPCVVAVTLSSLVVYWGLKMIESEPNLFYLSEVNLKPCLF